MLGKKGCTGGWIDECFGGEVCRPIDGFMNAWMDVCVCVCVCVWIRGATKGGEGTAGLQPLPKPPKTEI
jgi:hypothetical protein